MRLFYFGLLLSGISGFLSAPAIADVTVFHGATIFTSPQSTPIESGVIVLDEKGIIAIGDINKIEIPSGARRIDMTGKFITAGFWNSHVHTLLPSQAIDVNSNTAVQGFLDSNFLKWGFVYAVDTGSNFQVTRRVQSLINSGQLRGPLILTMGGSFAGEGGSPFYIRPITVPEFTSKAQAGKLVQQGLDSGLDGIKLFTGSWASPTRVVLMQADHVRAATSIAHQNGALVFAHPSDSDGARIAIENGVDVLAHSFPAELKGPWDSTLPDKMAKLGVALVPTLKLFRYDLTRLGLPPNVVDHVERIAIAQTAAAKKAGVTLLFGTDVGYMDDTDTTQEFRLMKEAGLDYRDILASLTTAPARKYRLETRYGKITTGYPADLIVLNSDPRLDVTAFADINMTIKNGRVLYTQ